MTSSRVSVGASGQLMNHRARAVDITHRGCRPTSKKLSSLSEKHYRKIFPLSCFLGPRTLNGKMYQIEDESSCYDDGNICCFCHVSTLFVYFCISYYCPRPIYPNVEHALVSNA